MGVHKVAAERTVECLADDATASIWCGRVLLHATPSADPSSPLSIDILERSWLCRFVGVLVESLYATQGIS